MEFTKEEIETIKAALISYKVALKINCIYCDSIVKDTNDYFEQHCETYKAKENVEKLIKKFEEIENE